MLLESNVLSGQGFVLKRVFYGDADVIVYVLSQNQGLLHFFARGAKKSKKRFSGGVLEPPNLIFFESNRLKKDPSSGDKLISLKEARILEDFSKLRLDFNKMNTLFLIIKVILLSEAGQEELFNHYGAAVKTLQSVTDYKRFFNHFVVRYLYIEGVLAQNREFDDYISTPLGRHLDLSEISQDKKEREASMASYLLKTYVPHKKEILWPK